MDRVMQTRRSARERVRDEVIEMSLQPSDHRSALIERAALGAGALEATKLGDVSAQVGKHTIEQSISVVAGVGPVVVGAAL
jgi:hypothetical protein